MISEVADRYAQGLYELARENDTVREKKEQCEELLKVLEVNDDFQPLLQAVKITDDEKKDIIKKVFGEYLDIDMIHFLELLIDKNRSFYLKEMLKEYVQKANDHLGIETATIYSARSLEQEDLDRIKAAIEKQTGKETILITKVDPSLIAGIKVTVGNTVTDITMKNKIDRMKETLLKGGLA